MAKVAHMRRRVPRWLSGRYTGLTIVLVVLSVSSIAIGQTDLRKVIDGVAFSVLLALAIRIVGQRLRVATVALVVPTLVSHWIEHLSDSSVHRIVGLGLATVFLVFLTLVIMFAVFRDETVTFDTIFGAVCAYLLLGVTWGAAYALLVVMSPDSLSVSRASRMPADGASRSPPSRRCSSTTASPHWPPSAMETYHRSVRGRAPCP